MVDFRENLDGLTAVLDEVGQEDKKDETMQEGKTKYVDTNAWDMKLQKSSQIKPRKNELFNFVKSSSLCFNKKLILGQKAFLTQDFGLFSDGLELLTSENKELNEDAIQYLLEKNDYINGFQFFVDVASGWSSYAHNFRNYILEECPKSSNIFVPVSALAKPITNKPVSPHYSYSNAIYCMAEWSADCDCVLPINLHYS